MFLRVLSSGGSLSSPYDGASLRSTLDALYGSNFGSNAPSLATFDALFGTRSFAPERTAQVNCTSGNAQITYPPASGESYNQPFEVRGVALAPDFESYSLMLVPEAQYSNQDWLTPQAWAYAVNRRTEPRNDVLAEAKELAPFLTRTSVYRLRLVVNSRTGLPLMCDRLVSLILPEDR
jgi:hypothetical protein